MSLGAIHRTRSRHPNIWSATALQRPLRRRSWPFTSFIICYRTRRIKKTILAVRAAVPDDDSLPLGVEVVAAGGGEQVTGADDESPRTVRNPALKARLEHARALDEQARSVAALRVAAPRVAAVRAVDGLNVHAAAIGAAAGGAASPPGSPRALRNQIWTALVSAAVFALWFCLSVCLLRWLQ